MATILDVAKEANVSTATVSRVLNGSYSVTDEKKRRVMEAVEKVGYQIPNRLPLRKDGTPDLAGSKKIMLVICSDYIDSILHPFQQAAAQMGYCVTMAHYDSPDEFKQLTQLIQTLSPVLAGILLLNCSDSSQAFQQLVGAFPLVQIGEAMMEHVPNRVVYNDEIKMGQDAADYLIDSGHRKIGFLTSDSGHSAPLFSKQNRVNGYFLSLLAHQLPVDQSLVQGVDISIDGGYEGCKRLLERHPDLDAIIGVTDVVSQGALYAIRRATEIKQDIVVFSMDHNEVWDFTRPNFPYINPHHEEMGNAAAHVLHAAVLGELERDYTIIIRHTLECVR